MKLIVGLGNPGEKYKNTRHNVGFVVLDKLAQELGIKNFESSKKLQSLIYIYSQPTSHNSQLVLAKPQTFMNNSGIAVKKLVDFYKVDKSNLWVIHDDLDIKFGQYKIQFGKGPKVHGGLLSIYKELGTKNFWHVRVGVDNRSMNIESRTTGEEYVLQEFTGQEELVLLKMLESIIGDLSEKSGFRILDL